MITEASVSFSCNKHRIAGKRSEMTNFFFFLLPVESVYSCKPDPSIAYGSGVESIYSVICRTNAILASRSRVPRVVVTHWLYWQLYHISERLRSSKWLSNQLHAQAFLAVFVGTAF